MFDDWKSRQRCRQTEWQRNFAEPEKERLSARIGARSVLTGPRNKLRDDKETIRCRLLPRSRNFQIEPRVYRRRDGGPLNAVTFVVRRFLARSQEPQIVGRTTPERKRIRFVSFGACPVCISNSNGIRTEGKGSRSTNAVGLQGRRAGILENVARM